MTEEQKRYIKYIATELAGAMQQGRDNEVSDLIAELKSIGISQQSLLERITEDIKSIQGQFKTLYGKVQRHDDMLNQGNIDLTTLRLIQDQLVKKKDDDKHAKDVWIRTTFFTLLAVIIGSIAWLIKEIISVQIL